MVARFHRIRHRLARGAGLAVVAAALVAGSGLPAQAQVFYSSPPRNGCQTLSIGPLAYSTCSPYYNGSSYYYGNPYYGNPYYYGYPNYYYGGGYYGGGPAVNDGPGEGGNGHP